MRRSFSTAAAVLSVLIACDDLHTAEIVGQVDEVAENTVRIVIPAGRLPEQGDPVEVYFPLEGIDDVALVATGQVTSSERGRVTARLDNVQGKVQAGMAVRITVGEPGTPQKPARPAPVIVGTVTSVDKRQAIVSANAGGTPRAGDAVAICFKVPGTTEVLKSGSGKVTAVRDGRVVVQITEGFALPGQAVRISAGTPKPEQQGERKTPPGNSPAEKEPSNRGREVAVQALQQLGGKVTRLADGRVFVVDLSNTAARDPDLASLIPLKSIAFLALDHTRLTDEGLQHIRGLRQLESLSLGGTDISDAGLANLCELRRLAVLILRDTGITNDGLRHLGALEKLELLDVGGTDVTKEGAESIKTRLPALKTLIGVGTPREAAFRSPEATQGAPAHKP